MTGQWARSVASQPVVLVGFMGAGKSTAGRRLAELLGREFLDLDDLVAALAGRPAAGLLSARGEAVFRRVECRALAMALATRDTVVATGGGLVTVPANRRALARAGCPVVWLEVPAGEAWARVAPARAGGAGGGGTPRPARPLLPPDEAGTGELLRAREPLYRAAATHRVETAGRTVEDVATAAAAALGLEPGGGDPAGGGRMTSGGSPVGGAAWTVVEGGPAGHGPVVVGSGLLERLAGLPGFPAGVDGPVFVAADPLALSLFGGRVAGPLRAAGMAVTVHALPGGERAKTPASLARLWAAMARSGLTRRGLVVSLGGGAASDLAGFAAATFMRGVPVAHVPTTLLGQVDAALGGKTAIDLPAGKNLAGAFHFPALVAIDPGVCRTLPPVRLAEGMTELVKTLLVAGVPPARLREQARSASGDGAASGALEGLVLQAVRAKLAVTGLDPKDTGPRLGLNLGHTFGHALETAAGYRLSHGYAVAIGLLAAARVSERLGLLPGGLAAEVEGLAQDLVAAFPARYARLAASLEPEEVAAGFATDKKRTGRGPVFVLLKPGPAGGVAPVLVADVPAALLAGVLASTLGRGSGPSGEPVQGPGGRRRRRQP